jgi:hypothetical protein
MRIIPTSVKPNIIPVAKEAQERPKEIEEQWIFNAI